MFGMEAFWYGWQQDLRLAIVPPIICAVFRFLFIYIHGPRRFGEWDKGTLQKCFSYGFWWGMDINSRYYLISLIVATLPGMFFSVWYDVGQAVRLLWFSLYLLILYIAFIGKMLFFYHFHDIYNRNIWLGKNADKKNLLDIFFNQNHGLLILFSIVPYMLISACLGHWIQEIPSLPFLSFENNVVQYSFNVFVFLFSIALYYWFNFGGTFRHRLKPEWDEVPSEVKNDVFLGKATVDDLVALKILWRNPVPEFMKKDEQSVLQDIQKIIPEFTGAAGENPLTFCKRKAEGARIKKPSHIFVILEESHCQLLYDQSYSMLDVAKYTKKLRAENNAVAINNFQPGGMISQTSLSSFLLGIYDCDIELNENVDIWNCNLAGIPTNFAGQLKKLGYKTHFWYGGGLNWGSLVHFLPAVGFDVCAGGPEFCPVGSPQTWLGVYDHIFLNQLSKKIKAEASNLPELHFIYTTSNHGPYNIPYEDYGIHEQDAVQLPLGRIQNGDMDMRRFTGILYADRAVADFVHDMREAYPDSLFVLTGDHASAVAPFDKRILPRNDSLLRERILTSFSMHHPGLHSGIFGDTILGEHLNILPTLIELIAPEGFEYYSLKGSLFDNIEHVVTPYSWMNSACIGYYNDNIYQQLGESSENVDMVYGDMQYEDERNMLIGITTWLVKHPELLKNSL